MVGGLSEQWDEHDQLCLSQLEYLYTMVMRVPSNQ